MEDWLRAFIKLILLLFLFPAAAAVSAETVVVPGGKETTLKVGGLVQVQGDFLDRGDNRFTTADDRIFLRRARLNATGSFLESFDFKIELDLSGSLTNNAIIGGNLRAQMTDGYINWNKFSFASIKGGQFKSPFGFEQLYSDPRLFTIERTLVNDRLTLGRQIGAQVAGDVAEKRLSYALGVFNGNGVNTTANDNGSFLFAERVSGTAWQGKLFGMDATWNIGEDISSDREQGLVQSTDLGFSGGLFSGLRRGVGLDSQVHAGPFEAWAEYLRVHFEPVDQIPIPKLDAAGWYVLLTYMAIPQKLMLIGRYETFDRNLDVVSNSTHTWTLGFNYFFKGDDLCFRFNYLRTDNFSLPDIQNKLLFRFQIIF